MTLYREIAAGRLAAVRIRDRLLIPRIVLERIIQDAISRAIEGVRDARSGGYTVQPAAQTDQRAGGSEDIPEPVQQPAPAA